MPVADNLLHVKEIKMTLSHRGDGYYPWAIGQLVKCLLLRGPVSDCSDQLAMVVACTYACACSRLELQVLELHFMP